MKIIGISAFYHDSSACLIVDENIISAAQEERFSRIKYDSSFPAKSINFCLKNSNLKIEEIDYFVFYEKPFVKFDRILETFFSYAPKGYKNFSKVIPLWIKEKLFQKNLINKKLNNFSVNKIDFSNKIKFSDHHLSHAASAFYCSPFENSAILTIDAVGEWNTTTISTGIKNDIKKIKEINFPHSIGLLYSSFTYYCGFKVNSGEYKLMGLSPYGEPIYENLIDKYLIKYSPDGSFSLNMEYFSYCYDFKMINLKFENLFGKKARSSDEEISKFYMNIAASIQKVTEKILLNMVKYVKELTNMENLCLAGGVALNCVANGKILKSGIFKNIWVQPASGDAGGSIGAALLFYYMGLKNFRKITNIDKMTSSYLGPKFSNDEILRILNIAKANFRKMQSRDISKLMSEEISKGKVVGWFQGKMEFGPRALGNRSILADPRNPLAQKEVNLKIKFRESFRPFAPTILEEYISYWFDVNKNFQTKYMSFVLKIKDEHKNKNFNNIKKEKNLDIINQQRSSIPAVTHLDYTARVQTVNKKDNENFYNLIDEFRIITGVPILLNTSFNVRGEPVVNSPLDAIDCFMKTNLDYLVLENFVLDKKLQKNIRYNKHKIYEPD